MDKKDIISNEFINLFNKYSFEEIDLDKLDKTVDYKTKEVFKDKYAILDYILRDKLNEKIELINSLKDKNIDLQNKLILFFDYHFDFLKTYPKISELLIKTSMIEDDQKLEIINKYMKKFKLNFTELIESEIKKNKVREVDPSIIASAILHATHGVTVRIKYDDNYDYGKAKKELVNFIYLGLNN